MAPARAADGKLVLVPVDDEGGKTYIGTKDGSRRFRPRQSSKIPTAGSLGCGIPFAQLELFGIDKQITALTIPTSGHKAIGRKGSIPQRARARVAIRRGAGSVREDHDGVVFRDNGRGSFVSAAGQELEPGWRTGVGLRNFSRMIHNPLVRRPFVRVFIWTFVFATSTVLLSFSLGLFLAITLDKKGMGLQRLYRSLPSSRTRSLLFPLLVGKVCSTTTSALSTGGILHAHIPGCSIRHAKVSVIVVSVWVTFRTLPCSPRGALQSIPSELTRRKGG
jgi:arabinogalactan oligomer/maltooligosaccharide transport system permease protein